MSVYQRILSPIDGSETSDCGMREAIHLAKDQQAQLRFLYVVDTYVLMMYHGLATLPLTDTVHSLRENGEVVVERAIALAREQGVQAERSIVESTVGRIAGAIIEQARDWPADLVVIGTHGRRGASRLVIGSDAEEVVRSSPVPVLLVRKYDSAR